LTSNILAILFKPADISRNKSLVFMDQPNSNIGRAGDANEAFTPLTVEQAVEAVDEAVLAIAVDVEVADALVQDEENTLLMG
jgi:hypothetical protein